MVNYCKTSGDGDRLQALENDRSPFTIAG